MNKYLKIFLVLALVGLVVGGSVVYYVFNMPHRDVEGEAPAFTMVASDFYNDYNSDEDAGNTKYLNQVIQVTGPIADISQNGIELTIILNDDMEGVSCALDSAAVVNNKEMLSSLEIGDQVTLKGKCDGFDMIMGIVLTKCFVIVEEE